jgi:anaerobic magnesium-protoporphyrin IX monomethyl ester cyclase
VVVQFSRGCPHLCNYCGQRGFWTRWRHHDPQAFAAEIAHLHRRNGVIVFDLADENPTTSKRLWRAFLEALIAEQVAVLIFATIRADDIVRDADILHLYKKAGVTRILLGLDNTDAETLRKIRKGGTTAEDRQAIQLLRQHGILSMVSYVVGFAEERDRDYWRGLRQLLAYDPDLIQCFFATPHRWTPYARMAGERRVIQTDLRQMGLPAPGPRDTTGAAVAGSRLAQANRDRGPARPRSLRRVVALPDPAARTVMRWYYGVGKRVWPHEVWHFLFRDRRRSDGPALTEFWGPPLDAEEEALLR